MWMLVLVYPPNFLFFFPFQTIARKICMFHPYIWILVCLTLKHFIFSPGSSSDFHLSPVFFLHQPFSLQCCDTQHLWRHPAVCLEADKSGSRHDPVTCSSGEAPPTSIEKLDGRFVNAHSEHPSNGKCLHAWMATDKMDSIWILFFSPDLGKVWQKSLMEAAAHFGPSTCHTPPAPFCRPLMCGSKVPLCCQRPSSHIGYDKLPNWRARRTSRYSHFVWSCSSSSSSVCL